ERLVDRAIDDFSSALGVPRTRIANHVYDYHHHDWTADPYSRGAYSYGRVNGGGASAAPGVAPGGRVVFAGGGARAAESRHRRGRDDERDPRVRRDRAHPSQSRLGRTRGERYEEQLTAHRGDRTSEMTMLARTGPPRRRLSTSRASRDRVAPRECGRRA